MVMAGTLESNYTSTVAKLLKQYDRFPEWERGIFRPISLQLAPTDKCNLNCEFCSVKDRDGDEMDINDIEQAVLMLVRKGLKTVEITGGGDPTCYEPVEHLIGFLNGQGLRIGLITNGLLLNKKIGKKYLDMLTWLRVSMNCLDYVDFLLLPELGKNTTLGFSYVISKLSNQGTVSRIFKHMAEYKVFYLRVVPNCLTTQTMRVSKVIAKRLGLLKHPKAFFQSKKYDVPLHCRIGYIKPFLAPDGYFYHCSANPLILRKFNPRFIMGYWFDTDSIWQEPYTPFNTDVCQEGKCFFGEHNDLLDTVAMEIKHEDFV